MYHLRILINMGEIMVKTLIDRIKEEAEITGSQTGRPEFSEAVYRAIEKTPRHLFVSRNLQAVAYENTPLPITCGQTISQPFIVALMTDLLDIKASDRVLEIGTGSGYQAAVLSHLAKDVYSVEIIEKLGREAKKRPDPSSDEPGEAPRMFGDEPFGGREESLVLHQLRLAEDRALELRVGLVEDALACLVRVGAV